MVTPHTHCLCIKFWECPIFQPLAAQMNTHIRTTYYNTCLATGCYQLETEWLQSMQHNANYSVFQETKRPNSHKDFMYRKRDLVLPGTQELFTPAYLHSSSTVIILKAVSTFSNSSFHSISCSPQQQVNSNQKSKQLVKSLRGPSAHSTCAH